MKKSTISYALIAAALLGSISAVAFAQQGGPGIQAGVGANVNVGIGGGQGYGGGRGFAGGNGSSTMPRGQGRMGGRMGIVGTVTDVESGYLTIQGREMNNATTTYTVDLTGTTSIMNGTSTGSLSDIAVGTRIAVNGPLATSTDTVTANTVTYGLNFAGRGNGMAPGMGRPGQGGNGYASATADASVGGGFFHSIGSFFKRMFSWI